MQPPGGAIIPDSGRLEWSALFRGSVSQYRDITPRLAHEPAVLLFGRLLSMDENIYLPSRVDEDIFTNYKSKHRAGLVPSESLYYRPWLDTEWSGHVALVTNDNFITADHLTVLTVWKQLVGDLQLDTGYRFIEFFHDHDRAKALARHVLELNVSWDCWWRMRTPVELTCGWQHDFSKDQDSVNLYLTWHFLRGRGYYDFRPDEIGFLDLRRRRAAEMQTNHVWQEE